MELQDIPWSWAFLTFCMLKCTLRSKASACNMATRLSACTIWSWRMDRWSWIMGWWTRCCGVLCSSCTCRWSGFVLGLRGLLHFPVGPDGLWPQKSPAGEGPLLIHTCVLDVLLMCLKCVIWSHEVSLHFLDTLPALEPSRLLSVGS